MIPVEQINVPTVLDKVLGKVLDKVLDNDATIGFVSPFVWGVCRNLITCLFDRLKPFNDSQQNSQQNSHPKKSAKNSAKQFSQSMIVFKHWQRSAQYTL